MESQRESIVVVSKDVSTAHIDGNIIVVNEDGSRHQLIAGEQLSVGQKLILPDGVTADFQLADGQLLDLEQISVIPDEFNEDASLEPQYLPESKQDTGSKQTKEHSTTEQDERVQSSRTGGFESSDSQEADVYIDHKAEQIDVDAAYYGRVESNDSLDKEKARHHLAVEPEPLVLPLIPASNNPTPTVVITGVPGSIVHVLINGQPSTITTTIGNTGQGSITLPKLPDGSNALTFTQTAPNGLTSAPQTMMVVTDTTVNAADDKATATEDQFSGATTGNVLTNDDHDGTEVLTRDVVGKYGTYHFQADGSYVYELDNSKAQDLALGSTYQDSVIYEIKDAVGNTTTATLTTTIIGTNDAAVITGIDTAQVDDVATSGQILRAPGKLTITDADNGEAHFNPEVIAGKYGSILMIQANGVWEYSVDRFNPDVLALPKGTHLGETFTVTSADGTTHVINVDIVGSNTPAIIIGTDRGITSEGLSLDVHGQLNVMDSDTGEDHFIQEIQQGKYGQLEIDDKGQWHYQLDNNNPRTQALRGGELEHELFFIKSADGTPHAITIDVNGTNDMAAIGGIDSGMLKEDSQDIAGKISASGQLSILDIDQGENIFPAQRYPGQYGQLYMASNGQWTYMASNTDMRIQHLAEGEVLNEKITIQSADGSTHEISILIAGTNDAPILDVMTVQTATEDGAELTGQITSHDVDTTDGAYYTATNSPHGFTLFPNGNYKFEPDNAAYDHLAKGQTATLIIPVTVSDGHGGFDTKELTIVVTGTNDKPTITGVDVATVSDNANAPRMLLAGGQLIITDVDDGEAHFQPQLIAGKYGSVLQINADGSWHYSVDRYNPDVVKMTHGDHLDETFVVKSADGTTHTIHTQIEGDNIPSIITGSSGGLLTEDAIKDTVAGQLFIMDVDRGDSHFKAKAQSGKYGSLVIDDKGAWHYTLDDKNSDTQALRDGESQQETFIVTGIDGTPHAIVIRVFGTNDAASITGVDSGSVTEDHDLAGVLETSGRLAITDADRSEAIFPVQTITGRYGQLHLANDGTWGYVALNNQSVIQQLGATETLHETITVHSADGTTHIISITVHGTNDTPVIGGVTATTMAEGSAVINGQLASTDVDTTDTPTYLTASKQAGFVLKPDGSYSIDPTNVAFEHLAVGEQTVLTIPVTVTDNNGGTSTSNIEVTITGTNDNPVIGSVAATTVAEGSGVINGQLTSTDVDTTDTATYSTASTQAGFVLKPDGSYSIDPTNAAFEHLAVGEQTVLTIPVTVTDNNGGTSTTNIEVTITGTNDNPIIGSVAATTVAEGSGVINGQLTSTDVDTTDTATYSTASTQAGFVLNPDGSYTIDPTDPAFEHLAEGEVANLLIPVTVTDNNGGTSTTNIEVHITGTNDDPTVTATSASPADLGSTNEDTDKVLSEADILKLVGASDADTHDTLSIGAIHIDPKYGSFTHSGTNWIFHPAHNVSANHIAISVDVTDGKSMVTSHGTLNVTAVADGVTPTLSLGSIPVETHHTAATTILHDQVSSDLHAQSGTSYLNDFAQDISGYRASGQLALGMSAASPSFDWSSIEDIKVDGKSILSGTLPFPPFLIGMLQNSDASVGPVLQFANIDDATMLKILNGTAHVEIDYRHGTSQNPGLSFFASDTDPTVDPIDFSLAAIGSGMSTSGIIGFNSNPAETVPGSDYKSSTIDEDAHIPLHINAVLQDTDGSEAIASVKLTGIPAGSTLSAGTLNADGSYSVPVKDLGSLTLTPPKDFAGKIHLQVEMVITDSTDGHVVDTITTTASLEVDVNAVAEIPTLHMHDLTTDEDHGPLALGMALDLNIDPSETQSVVINGLPDGVSLSAGTKQADGSWLLTPAELAGLKLITPPNYVTDINLSVTATAVDGSATASDTGHMTVHFNPLQDMSVTAPTDVSGHPTEAIALGIVVDSSGVHHDAGESLGQAAFELPVGWTVEGHTPSSVQHGKNIYDIDPADIGSLKVIPPAGFHGVQNLVISETITENGQQFALTLPIKVTVDWAAEVIGGDDHKTTNEDSAASGVLTITGGDTTNGEFTPSTVKGNYGSLHLDANGHWSYTPDGRANALAENAHATETIAVRSVDGQLHNIVISLTGTNDIPTVSAPVTLAAGEEDTTQTITPAQLLAHATDVDSTDKLDVANVKVDHGTITTDAAGNILFTPETNYHGVVNFTYDVVDGNGGVVHTSATTDLSAVDDAIQDSGARDLGSTDEDTGQHITEAQLLEHLTDTDGPLHVVGTPTSAHGTVTANPAGGYDFTPDANYHGPADLAYKVSDGTTEYSKTASLAVSSVTDAAKVGLSMTAEQEVMNFGTGDKTAYAKVDGINAGGPMHAMSAEITFVLDPAHAPKDSAVLLNYSTPGGHDQQNTITFWSASNLYFSFMGSTVNPGVNLLDGHTHRLTMTWESNTGHLAVYDNGVVIKEQTVNQGGTFPDGGTFIAGTRDNSAGADNSADYTTGLSAGGRVFAATIVDHAVSPDAVKSGAISHETHGVLADIMADGHGGFIDTTGLHTVEHGSGAQTVVVPVDTSAGTIPAGALLHLHPTATNSAADDLVTKLEITGLLKGTVLSDGHGNTHTMTGMGDKVDVLGWVISSLTAQLPHGVMNNMNVGVIATTTGPDGQTTTAAEHQGLSLDSSKPIPDASITGDDDKTTDEDTSVSGVLQITDSDASQMHFISGQIDTTHGHLNISTNGHWTFTPNSAANALGKTDHVQESITVSSLDGTQHQIVINIDGREDKPVVTERASPKTVIEDGGHDHIRTSGMIDITDADKGDTHTIATQTDNLGKYGHFSIAANGGWHYQLDNSLAATQALSQGQHVTETFNVVVTDSEGGQTIHQMHFDVQGSNEAPVADAKAISTNEDTDYHFSVADFGYTDSDGGLLDHLTLSELPQSSQGVLTLNGHAVSLNQQVSSADLPNLVFSPAANFNGNVGFKYTVNDGHDDSKVEALNVHVNAIDDNLVESGTRDLGSTKEDTSVHVTQAQLLEHLSDADGALHVVGTPTSAHGTVTANPAGGYDFTPNANYHGPAELAYKVSDGTTEYSKTASLAVASVTDEANVGLDVLAEQEVIKYDASHVSAGEVPYIEQAVAKHNFTQFTFEMTFVGSKNVPSGANLAGLQGGDGLGFWDPANLSIAIGGAQHRAGIHLNDGADHRVTVTWDSTSGELKVFDNGQLLHTFENVLKGQVFHGGDDWIIGALSHTAGALNSEITNFNFADKAISEAEVSKAPLYNILHLDPHLLTDIRAVNGAVTDTVSSNTPDTNTQVSTTPIDVHTMVPVPGALLHINPSATVTAPGDTITKLEIMGLVKGTVLSDGHGNTHTITGVNDKVDVHSWAVTSITAQLPHSSIQNMNLGLSATTTAPDGKEAVVTTHEPIIIDPTSPVPDALISGDDDKTTDEDSSISGVLSVTDTDASQAHFDTAPVDGKYGQLTMTADGHWVYTPDGRANALAAGAKVDDVLTVHSADGTTHQIAVHLTGTNDIPTITAQTISATEDTTHTFSAEQFGFRDQDVGDHLDHLTISKLPDSAEGILKFDGHDVTVGQQISATDAGKLTFEPTANFNGDAHFSYTVSDGTTDSTNVIGTVHFDPVNDAPVFISSSKIASLPISAAYEFSQMSNGHIDDLNGNKLNGASVIGDQGGTSMGAGHDGTPGAALELHGGAPGSAGAIQVPDLSYKDGIAISSWVRIDSLESFSRIFDFSNGPGKDNILLAHEGTSDDLMMSFWDKNGAEHRLTVPDTVDVGQWMHITGVITVNGDISLYKNGVQIGDTLHTGFDLPTVSRTINYIGQSAWGGQDPNLHGAIENFVFFERSIDATTVSQLYHAGDLGDLLHKYDSINYDQFHAEVLSGHDFIINEAEIIRQLVDVDHDTLSVSSVSSTNPAVHIIKNADGTYTVHTDPSINHTEAHLTVHITDGTTSIDAHVNLQLGTNVAPTVVQTDLGSSIAGVSQTLTAAELLAGTSDVDTASSSLSIVAGSLSSPHGTIIENADGTFSFTSTPGFQGQDAEITYKVTDGRSEVDAKAIIDVNLPLAITSISNDTGDSAHDFITSDNKLVFHGVGIPGHAVTVLWGGASLGTATVAADGTWALDYTAQELPDGTRDLMLASKDASGAMKMETQSLTIDSATPTLQIDPISHDDWVHGSDHGNPVTVSGTSTNLANGQLVSVTIGGHTYTAKVMDGHWALDIPVTDLASIADNNYKISAEAHTVSGLDAQAGREIVISTDSQTLLQTDSTQEDVKTTAHGSMFRVGSPDSITDPGTYEGNYGTLRVNADGTYTYTLNNQSSEVQALAGGEVEADNFLLNYLDDAGQPHHAVLNVGIHGTNDAPVLSGSFEISRTSDTGFNTHTHSTGFISALDVDNHDVLDIEVINSAGKVLVDLNTAGGTKIDEGPGSFSIKSDGSWDFTLDKAGAERDALKAELAAGHEVVKIILFRVTDSSGETREEELKVTISGNADHPVIHGSFEAVVTEDKEPESSGRLDLLVANVKVVDDLSWTVQSGHEAKYGVMTFAKDGTWHYTLNNNLAIVQHLSEGQRLEEAVLVTVTDEHGNSVTKEIKVDIVGTNDVPTILHELSGTVVEDNILTLTKADLLANIQDMDTNDVLGVNNLRLAGGGTLTKVGDHWEVHPGINFSGELRLKYDVTDGRVSIPNSMKVSVSPDVDAPTLYFSHDAITPPPVFNDPDLGAQKGVAIIGDLPHDNYGELVIPIAYKGHLADGETVVLQFHIDGPGTVLRDSALPSGVVYLGHAVYQVTFTGDGSSNELHTLQIHLPITGTPEAVAGSDTGHYVHVFFVNLPTNVGQDGDWTTGNLVRTYIHDAPDIMGDENSHIALNIHAVSPDSSEHITVEISGLPAGATLSSGTLAHGVWTVDGVDLPGLMLIPPADFHGPLSLDVTATSHESDGTTASTASETIGVQVLEVVPDASITGDDDKTTDEDGSVSGVLQVTDNDAAQAHFDTTPVDGKYGQLTMTADGHWVYTPNAAANALNTGDNVDDVMSVKSADGTLHQINIHLVGMDEASPVISPAAPVDSQSSTFELPNTLINLDANELYSALGSGYGYVIFGMGSGGMGGKFTELGVSSISIAGHEFSSINGFYAMKLSDYKAAVDEGFLKSMFTAKPSIEIHFESGANNLISDYVKDHPTTNFVENGKVIFSPDVSMTPDGSATGSLIHNSLSVVKAGPSDGQVVSHDEALTDDDLLSQQIDIDLADTNQHIAASMTEISELKAQGSDTTDAEAKLNELTDTQQDLLDQKASIENPDHGMSPHGFQDTPGLVSNEQQPNLENAASLLDESKADKAATENTEALGQAAGLLNEPSDSAVGNLIQQLENVPIKEPIPSDSLAQKPVESGDADSKTEHGDEGVDYVAPAQPIDDDDQNDGSGLT